MMKDLVAHELGMAMALCSFGAEETTKHRKLLARVIHEEDLDEVIRTFKDHTSRSEQIAEAAGMGDDAREACDKADKTFRTMHDTFVSNMEADLTHVLSWLAMANAGGIAIWSTLEGAADRLRNEDLEDLSNEALSFQRDMLRKAETALHDFAKEKVVA